ncbi:MAG: serine/threonine-protein kinase, partial [Acidobacteriota bacterium]
MRPVDLLCQLDRLPDASRRSVLERLDEPTLTDLVARGETVEAGAEPARLDSIDRLLVTGGGGLEGDLWDRLAAEIADEPEGHAALVGEEIGPVRIEGVLGRGGMGAVYRGFDTWLERPVAVKTLHDRFGRREDALERFRSEARLLSRLDHPNVCRIYGLQRFAGREFLVLELIEGTPLSELDLSTLDRGERLRIGRDVAAALIAAHERRVVHRDLKPANVMITEEGRAKVLDFGISQPFEAEDVAIGLEADAGAVIGTPRYMSPEQARGETPTPASDLYSFGLLLHELFTGRSARPEGHGLAASLDTAQRAETDLDDDLAPPLRRLIDGLLAPEPKGRPDAEATAEALRRIDEGPLRRRRRWIIAAGLALAALGMLATLSISRWRLERQAAFAQRFTQEVKDL